eukprot:COSAG06_NODE_5286_length_3585_cov_85.123924_1_plen_163_part_10
MPPPRAHFFLFAYHCHAVYSRGGFSVIGPRRGRRRAAACSLASPAPAKRQHAFCEPRCTHSHAHSHTRPPARPPARPPIRPPIRSPARARAGTPTHPPAHPRARKAACAVVAGKSQSWRVINSRSRRSAPPAAPATIGSSSPVQRRQTEQSVESEARVAHTVS